MVQDTSVSVQIVETEKQLASLTQTWIATIVRTKWRCLLHLTRGSLAPFARAALLDLSPHIPQYSDDPWGISADTDRFLEETSESEQPVSQSVLSSDSEYPVLSSPAHDVPLYVGDPSDIEDQPMIPEITVKHRRWARGVLHTEKQLACLDDLPTAAYSIYSISSSVTQPSSVDFNMPLNDVPLDTLTSTLVDTESDNSWSGGIDHLGALCFTPENEEDAGAEDGGSATSSVTQPALVDFNLPLSDVQCC